MFYLQNYWVISERIKICILSTENMFLAIEFYSRSHLILIILILLKYTRLSMELSEQHTLSLV
jgi:hypothetical protein